MKKYRVLRMAALLGVLILPGCTQGILEGIGTKTAAPIAEDDIEVAEAAENGSGQDSEGQIDTGDWIKAESPVQLPILMYHSISQGNGLRVPRRNSDHRWLGFGRMVTIHYPLKKHSSF